MKEYIHEISDYKEKEPIKKKYDVIVVGGGMSGLCAAIASARNGAHTAIIQERSVFGGNGSSEIRMHVAGASCHWGKENAVETGIMLEMQLHNQYLNYDHNFSIWDGVLWSTAMETEHLDVYLNTVMIRVKSDGSEIQWVECYQSTTESTYRMQANVYIDATGNGSLGYFAGAEYRFGCEDKVAYHEPSARDQVSGETMGNTIMFNARDTGHPVKFVKPEWAYTFDEDDLEYRYHGNITVYHDADKVVILGPDESYEDHRDQLVEKYDTQSGYWWIELGGDWDDIIKQAEDLHYELYRCVYGVWDHIKNRGNHGAENYELVWVGNQPGIREGRRLEGVETLTENDIRANRVTDQDVAYGGWPMDEHTAGGLRAKGQIPSKVRSFDGLYGIPYGCYCSKTIRNMMMVGRIIGASKLAMGSTRVMGTCAVGGQAVGTAAALAAKYSCTPQVVGEQHMQELRQQLLKDDCYIIGCKNEDPKDMARFAKVSASSYKKDAEPEHVINGVSRDEKDHVNCWSSDGLSAEGETLTLKLDKKHTLEEIRLTFDPNLSEEHCISLSKAFIEKIPKGVPKELVKDYELKLYANDNEVYNTKVTENYQRLNVIKLPESIQADTIHLHFTATNGCEDVRVFEVRAY